MAKKTIKARAKTRGGVTTVKALMTHPMETGTRKNKKTGKLIPAHFISEVKTTHKGNDVMICDWSGSISKNPYMSFKFEGASVGDELTIAWTDNQGNSDSVTTKVK